MNQRIIFSLLLVAFTLNATNIEAQSKISVLPEPVETTLNGNSFQLDQRLNIYLDAMADLDKFYVSSIFHDIGFRTYFTDKRAANLIVTIDKKATTHNEGYSLNVEDKRHHQIVAKARTKEGLLHALQTVRQLINRDDFSIPACSIKDEPAFPWRAFMLDESRHFQGIQIVKNLLDEMARLKMNIFHWHLVDDPGWRIEILQYPELTEIGSKKDFSNRELSLKEWNDTYPNRKMFYTQQEIREIVKYAANRGITIVPEIEMPGHASASILAYPWLGATSKREGKGIWGDLYDITKPEVEKFLQNVLDEVIALFPSKIIHIGGDEANYSHWQNNPDIVQFMKERDIPTFADLQVWSINRFSRYLTSKGVRMMGWNEITGDNIRGEAHMEASKSENLSPNTIIHFWDGDITLVNKAIDKGYDVVNSNRHFTYLDYPYEVITLEKAYSFDPYPDGLSEKDKPKIMGLGCQMWGEYTPNMQRLYFQTFPRLAAYAERGWTGSEKNDYPDFLKRFKSVLEPIWKKRKYLNDQPY